MVLRNKSAKSDYFDLLGGLGCLRIALSCPTYRVYTGYGYLMVMCTKSNTTLGNILPIQYSLFLSVWAMWENIQTRLYGERL